VLTAEQAEPRRMATTGNRQIAASPPHLSRISRTGTFPASSSVKGEDSIDLADEAQPSRKSLFSENVFVEAYIF
jgi:hypothetical protein